MGQKPTHRQPLLSVLYRFPGLQGRVRVRVRDGVRFQKLLSVCWLSALHLANYH